MKIVRGKIAEAQKPCIFDLILIKENYRKTGIRSRGFYSFWRGLAAACKQGRLLIEGGLYFNLLSLHCKICTELTIFTTKRQ